MGAKVCTNQSRVISVISVIICNLGIIPILQKARRWHAPSRSWWVRRTSFFARGSSIHALIYDSRLRQSIATERAGSPVADESQRRRPHVGPCIVCRIIFTGPRCIPFIPHIRLVWGLVVRRAGACCHALREPLIVAIAVRSLRFIVAPIVLGWPL